MKTRRVHVQIALVGGSPTPVYQGIIHKKPDQVILICSEQSENTASLIRQQLPFIEERNILIYTISDAHVEKMYETAEMIHSLLPKGISISLNITSGMKLWSIVFNNVFRRYRRHCQTFFIGQDGTFFDLKDRVTKERVDFDMDAQFKILGHELKEFTPLSDYTAEDFSVLNVIQMLGFNPKTHLHLFNVTATFVEEYKKSFGNNLYTQDFEITQKQNKLKWTAALHKFECQLGAKSYTFQSEHSAHIVLNTGWFELYVARLISKTYSAENIRLNCIFRNVKNQPKNEIDIIVNTGNKLIFVECKTQIYNATDIDKFRSAVQNYGGLGSQRLFVTYNEMKPEGLEKCKDHHIQTFYVNNPQYENLKDCTNALCEVMDKMNKSWNV